MQQHAERSAHLTEHLQHTVDNVVVLGSHVGLASDGGDSWHDDSLLERRGNANGEEAMHPLLCHSAVGNALSSAKIRETTKPDDAAEKMCFIVPNTSSVRFGIA
jgi:hypothetical protein